MGSKAPKKIIEALVAYGEQDRRLYFAGLYHSYVTAKDAGVRTRYSRLMVRVAKIWGWPASVMKYNRQLVQKHLDAINQALDEVAV